MVGLLVVVMIGGLIAFKQLHIEAFPSHAAEWSTS